MIVLMIAALPLGITHAGESAVRSTERPWGHSFVPRSNRPADIVRVVPMQGLSGDEQVALCCLQGLLARKRPLLWLERSAEVDGFWLTWHQNRGYIKGVERVTDWKALFNEHRSIYQGAVIADADLYRGQLIALNVAACEDMIVTTPVLAQQLGIEVKIDLRGRFRSYAEGMRWVWNNYKTKLNPFLCDARDPDLVPHATFDMAFQWRGLMFWLTGQQESRLPGVSVDEELRLFEEIFKSLGKNPVCIGFPAGIKEGFGIGEPQGVELISRFGMALSCNNHLSNTSVLSGIPQARFKQPEPLPAPSLDRTKIYIALVLSDGDNQILWPGFFRGYFQHKAMGSFPFAFGIGPATREMLPGIIEWYDAHAPRGVEFIADVSGAAYINPSHFGVSLDDKEVAWAGYLEWTRHLMKEMNLKTVRTVGGDDHVISRFIKGLPDCHSIFADMGRYSGRSGIDNLTYTLHDKPVFRSVTSWRYGKDGFLKEVHEQVGSRRPAFVNGFLHCWTFAMDDIVKIHADAGPEVVFVTPSQLAALHGQASRP
jgi:GxGYxY sequence motif in domain of unknown function N-terminal/GxGYxYP putative glycoside hydrolase C-terminal domain